MEFFGFDYGNGKTDCMHCVGETLRIGYNNTWVLVDGWVDIPF